MRGPSWYAYQQMIGANPFGAAQFYFDTAMPPFDATQTLTMETRLRLSIRGRRFHRLLILTVQLMSMSITIQEPHGVFVRDPLTVNFWRFTFGGLWTDYLSDMPEDLQQALL